MISLLSLNTSVFKTATKSAYTSSQLILKSNEQPNIIIDAGHGGEDGGASSASGILEKDINLEIALTLEKLLHQSGFNVVMIRNTDCSIHDESANTTRERKVSDIKNRVEISNSDTDNILISIHQNHFSENQYKGAQIFYSGNNIESVKLAESIKTSVTSLLQPENTRQCKEAENIYLLDNTEVPAVIIECGFLSNPEEADLLAQKDYRNSMAYSIYLGLLEYLYLNS